MASGSQPASLLDYAVRRDRIILVHAELVPAAEGGGILARTETGSRRITSPCQHLEASIHVAPPLDVCSTCVEIGGEWFHLRQCLACGRTSCCDESPNRHATAHHHETGHPMMRSAEPGEDWLWCFADDLPYVPGATGYVVPDD